MARSDEDIKRDVREQLEWDTRLDESRIDVDVHDGVVTLKGTTPSQYARATAYTDAWSIRGVKEVLDDLEVHHGPLVHPDDDAFIQSEVFHILDANANIDASKVYVDCHHGLITITGTVDAYWKRGFAEDLASGVTGVIDIDNQLSIVPTHKASDEEIAESVMGALARDIRVVAEDVNVVVENGVVKLSGSLPDYPAREAALGAAIYTPGVIDVEDHMTVSAIPSTYVAEQEKPW